MALLINVDWMKLFGFWHLFSVRALIQRFYSLSEIEYNDFVVSWHFLGKLTSRISTNYQIILSRFEIMITINYSLSFLTEIVTSILNHIIKCNIICNWFNAQFFLNDTLALIDLLSIVLQAYSVKYFFIQNIN